MAQPNHKKGEAGILGACTVKMALGLEKDWLWLGLEKDAPFTLGARGLVEKLCGLLAGLLKDGTRNPLNGFLNLNWAFAIPIKAITNIKNNFILYFCTLNK